MRVCTVYGAQLRINPLLIILLAGAMVLGRLDELLVAFCALTIHEISHAVVAALFGSRILSIELMPFGSVARLTCNVLTPYAELVIAAAGPLTSLIAAGIASCSIQLFPTPIQVVRTFLIFNLSLACINLLPVLPLDGGRMLRGLLVGRVPERRMTYILSISGIATGVTMIAGAVVLYRSGKGNLTLPVMGIFLVIAAFMELRRAPEEKLRSYIQRSNNIRSGANLPVFHIAASRRMAAREALHLMRSNRYNLLRVVDEDMHFVGELDEGDLLLGMARCGTGVTIGEILLFDRSR